MKTLKILAAFLFFTGVVVAQDMNATDVPASVKNAFSKEYAQATDVEWEKDMENYKVEFDLNKMENEVWYSGSGAVVKKEQDITEAELPQTVRDAVKSGYADYTLDDIEKVWQNNATIYELELEKGNEDIHLIFDANGKLIAQAKQ